MSEFFDRLLNGATKRETGPLPVDAPEVPMPQVRDVALLKSPKPQVPPMSTIEDGHHKARTLLAVTRDKKAHWERERDRAIEEVRQADIVIAGTEAMLKIVSSGMPDPEDRLLAALEEDIAGMDFTNNPS